MDMEKVIKGLECHRSGVCDNKKTLCPYWEEEADCSKRMITDTLELLKAQRETIDEPISADKALKLLKEQEAVSAHWDDDTGHWIEGDRNGIDPHTRTTGEMIDTFRCSWCGFYQYWKTPFCPNCGAKMKQEGR